jgi:hypothetical protein
MKWEEKLHWFLVGPFLGLVKTCFKSLFLFISGLLSSTWLIGEASDIFIKQNGILFSRSHPSKRKTLPLGKTSIRSTSNVSGLSLSYNT